MAEWTRALDGLVDEVGRNVKKAARTVGAAFRGGPNEIIVYRGYGTTTRIYVHGRALQSRELSEVTDKDTVLRNLLNTYRRAEVDPLPHARVRARIGDAELDLSADDEGFFGGWLDLTVALPDDRIWHDVEVELLAPVRPDAGKVIGKGTVLIPPRTATFAIISDIDDTVIQSRVSNFLQAARTVMLGNALTRLPFPGVAAFYTALCDGATKLENNPVFYVSSSPWNIYDVISGFMDHQKIPHGPLILRDWDINLGALSGKRHYEHKGKAIREIMNLIPDLPFILIGDTSQHDPEIYHGIVKEFPDRIRAIYIRDVTLSAERKASVNRLAEEILAAKSTLVITEDTVGAARHALANGWIAPDSIPDVQQEKRADEGKTDEKVATPDGGEAGSDAPPTVIGDSTA